MKDESSNLKRGKALVCGGWRGVHSAVSKQINGNLMRQETIDKEV